MELNFQLLFSLDSSSKRMVLSMKLKLRPHSACERDMATGKMEWKPIESFGGNAGGWEIVG